MIEPVKFFDNIFESTEITSTRLNNFAGDCLNRLTAANTGGEYTDLINLIITPHNAMTAVLNDVDTSLNIQKGKTLSVNQLVASFKKTMSEMEGVIAMSVGGFSSEGYMQFYPKGVTEYSTAIKANLPMLMDRVSTSAGVYKKQLGAPLTATLQGFATDWDVNRNQQQQQKGNVENNRTESSQVRTDLETALITVVHTIGSMFPGEANKCLDFFTFSLLKRSAPKTAKELITGSVLNGKTVVAVNRSFTAEAKTKITNNSANASLFVYLAPLADAQVNGVGKEIKAGKSRNFSIAELGDVNNTFLLVHNMSAVNEAGYKLEIQS